MQKSTTIQEATDAMIASPLSRKVWVIDVEADLVGVVTSEALLKMVG